MFAVPAWTPSWKGQRYLEIVSKGCRGPELLSEIIQFMHSLVINVRGDRLPNHRCRRITRNGSDRVAGILLLVADVVLSSVSDQTR